MPQEGREERTRKIIAALTGQYQPGVYERFLLEGEKEDAPDEVYGFLAIFRRADSQCEFTSGYDDSVTPAEMADRIQRLELPQLEAPGPYTVVLAAKQHDRAQEAVLLIRQTVLQVAQDHMDQFGLPAAIVAFMETESGGRCVEFWYPVMLVLPDHLFAAFQSWALNYDWTRV